MRLLVVVLTIGLAAPAWAANCYICGAGSSESCKNYCQYEGADTYKRRKRCSDAGCKVTGTASCPTAVNYKVCFVGGLEKSSSQRLAKRR